MASITKDEFRKHLFIFFESIYAGIVLILHSGFRPCNFFLEILVFNFPISLIE